MERGDAVSLGSGRPWSVLLYNDNDDDDFISIAFFHFKHAQLR